MGIVDEKVMINGIVVGVNKVDPTIVFDKCGVVYDDIGAVKDLYAIGGLVYGEIFDSDIGAGY